MAEINFSQMVKDMLAAAKEPLISHWNEAKPLAEKEFKAFAENIKLIAKLKLSGDITEEQAKLYLEIQKGSVRIFLLTVKGLGILAVETAINSAINTVKNTVNTALGWTIL